MIVAFCGAAGTGKTSKLLESAIQLAGDRTWQDQESLLGLTFMHGARWRLHQQLQQRLGSLKVPVQCSTIDSFALRVVRQHRSHFSPDLPIGVSAEQKPDWHAGETQLLGSFSAIRKKAVELLSLSCVQTGVRSSHPVIIIDEFQDCADDLLEIVKSLGEASDLLIAADEFQFLEQSSDCPAVAWLNSRTRVTTLTKQHRASNPAILGAASALRTNKKNKVAAPVLLPVDAAGLAAWKMMTHVFWSGWKNPVLLTPVSPDRSSFVKQTLASLSKQLGRKQKLGPLPFQWEERHAVRDQLLHDLSTLKGAEGVALTELKSMAQRKQGHLLSFARQCLYVARLSGLSAMAWSQIEEKAYQYASIVAAQKRRAKGFVAMTIHGAKNREFDYVFILWPHEVKGDVLLKRKLLYNAVTRARVDALVLSQGGSKRADEDPILHLLARH